MSKIEYKKTFAYHIEVGLGLNLNNIWNWEKNNENGINPYKIAKQSNKKVWLYCQEHDYHNYDREGNKIGYEITCANFYNNKRCRYCCGKHKIHYKDSIAYNYPKIAKMIAIEENNLTFEDCYNISCYNNKKFYFKCLECNNISKKRKILRNIVKRGNSCEFCSDGISIPNKFMANILKRLNINFITELSKSDFEWCGYFRYDFYLPKYDMIIEMNGEQHYIENATNNWKTLEQEQWNDLFKYKCAKGHVNNYIIIDCRNSTLEWMKENIIKELSCYFDLSNINWKLAWEESQNSLCVKTWELWNSGIHSTVEIGKILNLDRTTILKYLKNGKKINKCEFSSHLLRKENGLKNSGKNNYKSRCVICLTTGKIFYSLKEGAVHYNINVKNLCKCCQGERNYCGKLEDGTKLVWRYINWNHNKKYRRIS